MTEVTDGIFTARRFTEGDTDMIEFRRPDGSIVSTVRADAFWQRGENGERLTNADRIAGWVAPRAPRTTDPFDHDGDGKPGGSKPGKRKRRK